MKPSISALVPVILAGLLLSWDATATSLYTVSTYGLYGAGTGDSGPTAASSTDSFANSLGNWSATSTTNAMLGSGGHVTTNGFLYIPVGQDIVNDAHTTAHTQDTIRILATALAPVGAVVAVQFNWLVDGAVNGYGAWGLDTSLILNGSTQLGAAVYGRTTGGVPVVVHETISEVRSFTANLVVGTAYSLNSRFDVAGAIRAVSSPEPFVLDVDFANTGRIEAAVQTAGLGDLQLLGDSGRDYLLAAVPAPPAIWLLGTGLASLGGRRWLRRKISSLLPTG